jgi:hypothetical protein
MKGFHIQFVWKCGSRELTRGIEHVITEYKMWGDQGPQQWNRGGSRALIRGIEHVITEYKMRGGPGATAVEQGQQQSADTRD